MDCPPTPPTLPTGAAARTPPPKMSDDEDTKKSATKKGDEEEPKRPSSPDPTCAICLGKLQNMSYTNSCFHKFCFVCLVEWSKVKPECPLCKVKFKSIIHNIKSDDDYESYTLPPPPPSRAEVLREMYSQLSEMRRFRYPTTMGGEAEVDRNRTDAAMRRLEHIRNTMNMWRDQLPTFLPMGERTRTSSAPLWNRRRGAATSEFRRDIYRRNLRVDPDSVSDLTGRYRECSPAWYRTNPAQTHRLVPWLNRELNALLENREHQSAHVTQTILTLIESVEIRSPEFHERMLPYLANRTEHFQHEFYHFARSVYDMIGYDRQATYSDHVPTLAHNPNVTTEVISSDSEDEDDIVVVDQVMRTATRPTLQLTPPPASSATASSSAAAATSSTSSMSLAAPSQLAVPEVLPTDFLDQGPSTSRGETSTLPPYGRLVIPSDDSDDDDCANVEIRTFFGAGRIRNSNEPQQISRNFDANNLPTAETRWDDHHRQSPAVDRREPHELCENEDGNNDDAVEIVGVVKPRHERTPVIVDLSSDDEESNNRANRVKPTPLYPEEPIEISSDDSIEATANDAFEDRDKKLMEARKLAELEFNRVKALEKRRELQKRLRALDSFLRHKSSSKGKGVGKNSSRNDRTINVDDTSEDDSSDEAFRNSMRRAKMASKRLNALTPSTTSEDECESSSGGNRHRRKSVKHMGKGKKSSKSPDRSAHRRVEKRDERDDRRYRHSRYHDDEGIRDRPSHDHHESTRHKRFHSSEKSASPGPRSKKIKSTMRARRARLLNTDSSSSSDEEIPIARWKVTKKRETTTASTSTSNATSESNNTRSENLKLCLSRKKPAQTLKKTSWSSSTSDDEKEKRRKPKLKSLVFKIKPE